jgi:hypothetical protein
MTETLNLDGLASLELVYIDEPCELAYGADVLGSSEAELQRIVGMVGRHAIDVRRRLALVRNRRCADGLSFARTKLADVADGRARWRHA